MMEYGAFVTILFEDGKTILGGSSWFRGGHFGMVVCSKFGGRIRGGCMRRKGKFEKRGNAWVKCVVCSSLSVGVVGHVRSACSHDEGSARKWVAVTLWRFMKMEGFCQMYLQSQRDVAGM